MPLAGDIPVYTATQEVDLDFSAVVAGDYSGDAKAGITLNFVELSVTLITDEPTATLEFVHDAPHITELGHDSGVLQACKDYISSCPMLDEIVIGDVSAGRCDSTVIIYMDIKGPFSKSQLTDMGFAVMMLY